MSTVHVRVGQQIGEEDPSTSRLHARARARPSCALRYVPVARRLVRVEEQAEPVDTVLGARWQLLDLGFELLNLCLELRDLDKILFLELLAQDLQVLLLSASVSSSSLTKRSLYLLALAFVSLIITISLIELNKFTINADVVYWII